MKKYRNILCCLVALCLLGGCSPSPTAIVVGKNKVDAAELAFYLEYNRLNLQSQDGSTEEEDADPSLEEAKEAALEQIVTAEIVRQQCDKLDLELSKEEKEELKQNKNELIEAQGGTAGYLKYLRQSAMADRVYDKFQENTLYYDKLYDHMVGEGGEYSFSDVDLRQFFSENYATVQYIRLGFSSAPERGMDRAQTILEQAQVPGADFTQMVALYNDDPYMTENIQGIVMTASQCENSPQFETVFELEEGEITGVLVGTDGYYIVKRLPLAVTYYDDNQESILQEARDVQFNQLLEKWTEEASVRTTDIYKKMDFDNLWDYVE